MSQTVSYQPTCDLKAIKARANMYAQLRQFLLNVKCWKWKPRFYLRLA